MSVSIAWKPSGHKAGTLKYGGTSDWQAIQETFGENPTLVTEDLPVLRGMARVAYGEKNVFSELAELVERVGSVDLWGEF